MSTFKTPHSQTVTLNLTHCFKLKKENIVCLLDKKNEKSVHFTVKILELKVVI